MNGRDRPEPAGPPVRAVLFDLLSALLDSDAAWNAAAGAVESGRRWRQRYLALAAATGAYRPWEDLVHAAAVESGLAPGSARALLDRWDTIEPWPEADSVLEALRMASLPVGVVTNCSEHLGLRAAGRLRTPPTVVVTAERAGAYKPDPRPYLRALEELGGSAGGTLFVAGSPFDITGASGIGMRVVWHNRLGLGRPAGCPAPLAELATLNALPDLLGHATQQPRRRPGGGMGGHDEPTRGSPLEG